MKSFWILLLVTILLWSAPASAEYCAVKKDGNITSCIYKVDRIPKDSQIVISYTKQGWSMLIAVFVKEFAIIEGDARLEIRKGEFLDLEHVSTQRDVTYQGRLMEAPIYKVNEEVLHELANASGKVKFWLTATESKDVQIKVASSQFDDIDAYIAETKEVLGALFEEQ